MEHLAHHHRPTFKAPTMPLQCLELRFLMCADLTVPPTRSTQRRSIEMENLTHHQINIQGTDDAPMMLGIEILNVRRFV